MHLDLIVVDYAIERQVLRRFPGLFTEAEIHALSNLGGIPNAVTSRLHLSEIRKAWNEFYRRFPNPTREQVTRYAENVDRRFGNQFNPPR